MKRITPEDVVDAYIATGMYPVFRKWTTRNGQGGCALTTLGAGQGCSSNVTGKHAYYTKRLGLEYSYTVGFVSGFDRPRTVDMGPSNNDPYEIGRYDGRVARLAVKAHFAKAKKEKALKATQPQLAMAGS